MRFFPDHCPTCGHAATSTVETVRATARICRSPEGIFDYVGDTDIDWDSQSLVEDARGQVTLCCDDFHEWQAMMMTGRSCRYVHQGRVHLVCELKPPRRH